MYHEYSIEKLVHYRCSTCGKWWTIGDGPTNGEMACPWCGWQDDIEPIKRGVGDHG